MGRGHQERNDLRCLFQAILQLLDPPLGLCISDARLSIWHTEADTISSSESASDQSIVHIHEATAMRTACTNRFQFCPVAQLIAVAASLGRILELLPQPRGVRTAKGARRERTE